MAGPVDNAELPDSAILLRRVKPIAESIESVGDNVRPTSAVFRDGRGELSVSQDVQGKLEEFRTRYPDAGIVSVNAGYMRKLGYWVVFDPTDEDPHHHYIYNPSKPPECLRKVDARNLSRGSDYTWRYCPEGLLEIAQEKARRSSG